MSAYEDLHDQLLESVARRRRRHDRPPGWRLSRPRRGAGGRRGLLLVALPLVFAAAAAATIATQAGESPENVLLNRVLRLTDTGGAARGACRIAGGRLHAALSDEAPDPRIIAVLPQLATAPRHPPSRQAIAFAEHNSGGPVLARTIREVHLPGGITLIMYVAHGQGPFTTVDPRRCLAARLSELARLRPRAHDPLRQEVARELQGLPDTNPGLQSLTLDDGVGGAGASIPLSAEQRPLQAGVVFSATGCDRGRCSPILFGGIAGPATAYLTLTPVRRTGSHSRGVRRRIAVAQGVFAFTIPRGSGSELLTLRARAGEALATSLLGPERRPPKPGSQDEEQLPRPTHSR
ncbi:MAG TPA: hypothetical protein VK778_08285 [Solirubrobacteraceae bacterium]|jgi:hypothetical protein|nr:hypothetical protein [Solirubrobacteraceae bacterium]